MMIMYMLVGGRLALTLLIIQVNLYLRISNDNGNTFGPTLMLGNNGTLTGGVGGQGQAQQKAQ